VSEVSQDFVKIMSVVAVYLVSRLGYHAATGVPACQGLAIVIKRVALKTKFVVDAEQHATLWWRELGDSYAGAQYENAIDRWEG
jgi:hypothetical protein